MKKANQAGFILSLTLAVSFVGVATFFWFIPLDKDSSTLPAMFFLAAAIGFFGCGLERRKINKINKANDETDTSAPVV